MLFAIFLTPASCNSRGGGNKPLLLADLPSPMGWNCRGDGGEPTATNPLPLADLPSPMGWNCRGDGGELSPGWSCRNDCDGEFNTLLLADLTSGRDCRGESAEGGISVPLADLRSRAGSDSRIDCGALQSSESGWGPLLAELHNLRWSC